MIGYNRYILSADISNVEKICLNILKEGDGNHQFKCSSIFPFVIHGSRDIGTTHMFHGLRQYDIFFQLKVDL